MQFFGYQECNDTLKNLKSFTLIMSDKNLNNWVKLNPVGAITGDTCQGYAFHSPDIIRAAIYADQSRVYGMRLQTAKDVTDLGRLTGKPYHTWPTSIRQMSLFGFMELYKTIKSPR